MADENKNPAAGNGGAKKCIYTNLIKPKKFPQEPIMWQAHRICIQRLQDDPTPVNLIIGQVVASHWKSTFESEVIR